MKKVKIVLVCLFMFLSSIMTTKADGLISANAFTVRSSSGVTEFFVTDNEMSGYIDLELSSGGGAILKVKTDKRLLNVRLSPFPNSDLTTYDNNSSLIGEYRFDNVSAGSLMSIPFTYVANYNYGYISNMTRTPIVVELYDIQGNLIETKELELTLKHRFPDTLTYNRAYYSYDGFEDDSNPGYLSTDLQKLSPVNVNLSISRQDSLWHSRNYSKGVLEIELPAAAVVDSSLPNGWTYDALNHKATYTVNSNQEALNVWDLLSAFGNADYKLKTYFPGAQIGSTHEFKFSLTLTPIYLDGFSETADDGPFTLNTTYSHTIMKRVLNHQLDIWKSHVDQYQEDSFYMGYFDTLAGRSNIQKWQISGGWRPDSFNPVNLDKFTITDTTSEYLHILSAEVRDVNHVDGPVKISVLADANDSDNWTVYEASVTLVPGQVIDFSQPVYGIRIETLAGTLVPANSYISLYVFTEFRDKTLELTSTQDDLRYIYNHIRVSGDLSGSDTLNISTSNYFMVRQKNSSLTLRKFATDSTSNVFYDTVVPYQIELTGNDFMMGDKVEDFKIIDVLPKGVQFEVGSAVYSFGSDSGGGNNRMASTTTCYSCVLTSEYDMKIVNINNYNNTGHSALVFDFGDLAFLKNHTNPSQYILRINYSIKFTSLVSKGENINGAFMKYDSPYVTDLTGLNFDYYDLNQDGSTNDVYRYSIDRANFLPPANVVIQKEVKGSKDNTYLLSPSYATGSLGSYVDYKFNVSNHFETTDLSDFTFIDILPYQGDTSLVTYQNQGVNDVIDRGSTFDSKLVGPISAPNDYEAFYTTSDPRGLTVKEFNQVAVWQQSVTDYTSVTAFKLVLKSGSIFARNTSFIVDAQLSIPNDSHLDSSDQIVNSVAFSINGGQDFVESNFATLKLDMKKIDGTVFVDSNENGLFEDTLDTPLSGHNVGLYHSDGTPVNGQDGLPITTQTDSLGYYSFLIESNGVYKVKVLPASHHNPTIYDASSNGSKLSDRAGYFTDSVSVDENFNHATLNVGFVFDRHTITFKSNGGNPVSAETVTHGETFTQPEVPQLQNYVFEGWYRDEALTNAYDFSMKATEDITVYAKWSKRQYTISYETHGGSFVASETVDANELFTRPQNPAKANYVFGGWYLDAELVDEYTFTEPATQNIMVHAKWVAIPENVEFVTLIFNSNGGTFVSNQTVEKGTVFTKPSDPVKTNHRFMGWYLDEGLSQRYDFATVANMDRTVYAKWEILETSDGEKLPITGVPSDPTGIGMILLGSILLIINKRKRQIKKSF